RPRRPARRGRPRRDDARHVRHRRVPRAARPAAHHGPADRPADRAGPGGRRRGRLRRRRRRLRGEAVQPAGAGQPRRGGPRADAGVAVATVATTVLAVLIGAVAVLGGVIAGGRAVRRLGEARRARLAAPARRSLLALAAGDDDPEVLEALVALPRATWRAVEPTAVALLGKVRGEAYAALVSVLERRGMADRALRDVHRWGAIRRARAAEVLGSLRRRDAVPPLRHLLTDPDPDVRMVAVRALGRIGDADSATPLLQALVGPRPIPPQLIAQALMGLGAPAQPLVEAGLGHPDELVRATAAEVLGL